MDGALHLLARNVLAQARPQQALAVRLAGAMDDRIADEDPDEAGGDHRRKRSASRSEIAADDERHVLGQRHAQPAADEDEEHADVGGRPVEVEQESEEPKLQQRRPRCWDFRPTLCGDPPGGKLATFRLPFADLPDEKLSQRTFCFPQPFGKVLREATARMPKVRAIASNT